jgi:hypothetical protein
MNSNSLNENWFSIDTEEKMEKRIIELEKKDEILNNKLKELEMICMNIQNENMKLINRVLETEISLERTKNILLRKNISFPFTPFHWTINDNLNILKNISK